MKNVKRNDLPCQEYRGKFYHLHKGERYFSLSNTRLHVVVWETENNTKVPSGFHVHHKDENTHNNDISNLEIIYGKKHLSNHIRKRMKSDPEFILRFQDKGQRAAVAWHKSVAGSEQHRKQAMETGFGKWDIPEKNCEFCLKLFKPNTFHARFCHPNCKAAERRRLVKLGLK